MPDDLQHYMEACSRLKDELADERARREEAERMLASIAAKPDGDRVSIPREYYDALLTKRDAVSSTPPGPPSPPKPPPGRKVG